MDSTKVLITSSCTPPVPVPEAAINLVAVRFQDIVEELRREAWRIEPYDAATALKLDAAAEAFCDAGTSILHSWLTT